MYTLARRSHWQASERIKILPALPQPVKAISFVISSRCLKAVFLQQRQHLTTTTITITTGFFLNGTFRIADAYRTKRDAARYQPPLPLPVPQQPPTTTRSSPSKIAWSTVSRFTSKDVTVVIPTTRLSSSLAATLASVIDNAPARIIVVTPYGSSGHVPITVLLDLERHCYQTEIPIVRATAAQKNKRHQLIVGIRMVDTPFVALNDDDSVWSPRLLSHLLRPFEDNGTCKALAAVRPPLEADPLSRDASQLEQRWHSLSAWHYRTENMRETAVAARSADSGIPTVNNACSTTLYRTSILQSADFENAFLDERWRGRLVHSGDEMAISRWLKKQKLRVGWVNTPDTVVRTSVKTDRSLIQQWVRWGRFMGRHEWRLWRQFGEWTALGRFVAPLLPIVELGALLWGGHCISKIGEAVALVVAFVYAQAPVLHPRYYVERFTRAWALFSLSRSFWQSTDRISTSASKSLSSRCP